jgi:TrmH family RNA methyltransferase
MITSTANERVKWLRKLQERKARQESSLFYIEGLRIVTEAVRQGAQIETLVVAPELLRSDFAQQLVHEQQSAGMPVLELSADVFRRVALKDGPQGLAAVVRQRWVNLADVHVSAGHTWVALDAVADPGNLGTILRTHDAVGGQGVILLDQSTDPYDPSSARASMGALFTQRLVRVAFAEFVDWKHSLGVSLVGTSGAAQQDYHGFAYPDALVLLMGSERQGLQAHHLALCDSVVRIPMLGASDSLNLAVATALVLYEILNQRRDNHDRNVGR